MSSYFDENEWRGAGLRAPLGAGLHRTELALHLVRWQCAQRLDIGERGSSSFARNVPRYELSHCLFSSADRLAAGGYMKSGIQLRNWAEACGLRPRKIGYVSPHCSTQRVHDLRLQVKPPRAYSRTQAFAHIPTIWNAAGCFWPLL